jgi:hypothetical protein
MVSYKDVPVGSVPIAPLRIRYKGTWDMQDFYESVINHMRERKWKFQEKVYKHKHPSPFGAERQYVWYFEQLVDDFVKVAIDVYIHTYDAHEFETVTKNGERKLLTEGKIWVQGKVFFSWNVDDRWEKNSWYAELRKFLVSRILVKKNMLGYAPRYRSELVDLHQFIMNRLKLESRAGEYPYITGVHRRGP